MTFDFEHEEHDEGEHDEPEGEEEHHEEEEGLPIFLFQSADAELYGLESQFVWKATKELTWTVQADMIKGELKDGGNLPRIPPARIGLITDYQLESTDLSLSVMHNLEQSDIGAMENETGAYTIVDFVANHYISLNKIDITAYFKVNNLFDEEGRVHSSFLKDRTLLPGRGFTLGLRGAF